MFCSNCGKSIQPGTKFCPHCGTLQATDASAQPSPLPPVMLSSAVLNGIEPAFGTSLAMPMAGIQSAGRGGTSALWAGVGALVLALVGGVGYWGWSNKVAGEETVRKLASDEAARKATEAESARRIADEKQRRLAAEKTAESAEIGTAQALLDKHIAAEEAQAQAGAQGLPRKK